MQNLLSLRETVEVRIRAWLILGLSIHKH